MKCLVIILITVSLAWTMPLDQDPENTEDMITGKSICVANFLYNIQMCLKSIEKSSPYFST